VQGWRLVAGSYVDVGYAEGASSLRIMEPSAVSVTRTSCWTQETGRLSDVCSGRSRFRGSGQTRCQMAPRLTGRPIRPAAGRSPPRSAVGLASLVELVPSPGTPLSAVEHVAWHGREVFEGVALAA